MADLRNRVAVAQQLVDLGRQGCLIGRDDLLLRTVAEVGGLTLGQARRLGWPEASTVVAYQRLNRLRGWGLLASTPLPLPGDWDRGQFTSSGRPGSCG